jgi:DNA-binding CsgD family transcriptional regulator
MEHTMPPAESVYTTIDNKPNPALLAAGSRSSVTQPVQPISGGLALSIRQSWASSTVFRTLPPLPSVQAEPDGHDPAIAMLAAVAAAGGCLEVPECGYCNRWVVPRPGGAALRFPSPVGHRLVSQGVICRHPSDLPGQARRFVRYIPREQMPPGFEFQFTVAGAAQPVAEASAMSVSTSSAPTLDIPVASRGLRFGERSRRKKDPETRPSPPASIEVEVDPILSAIICARNPAELPSELATIRGRMDSLTPTERRVLAEALTGAPNKVIAHRLGRSQRTIESHRFSLMTRLGAPSFAALAEMVFILRVADVVGASTAAEA